MEIEKVAKEIKKYKKIGLFKKPKNKLLNFLDLRKDEKILINLRLFPLKSIFINNVRERYAKRLVLTNKKIFIINRGWVLKEVIPFSKITDILVTKRWDVSRDFPVIIIKTANDIYEILFYTFLYPRKKIKRKIKRIVECIKEGNSLINVNIDKKYDEDLIREVFFTRIKFK